MTFPEAIFPQRYSIAGVALQPFCVGHALLLERLNSPVLAAAIMSDEQSEKIAIGPGDLAQFLFVCSRDPVAAWSVLESMSWRARWFLQRHGRRLRRQTALVALLARAYVQRYYQGPGIKGSDRKGVHIPAMPVMAGILTACMADLGMTMAGAMNLPLCAALWLIGVCAARNGVVELSWSDKKALLAARLMQAAEGGKDA